jgi:Domain of unknown function (DUF4279)
MQQTELQTIAFDEETNTQSIYVEFRVRGDELNPNMISQQLEIQPTRSWSKGETYLGKVFNPTNKQVQQTTRKRPWGIWVYNTSASVNTKRVEDHISFILNLLEPKHQELRYYVELAESYSVSFSIYWKPLSEYGSYEISGNALARLSTLCHYTEFSCSFQ